MAEEFEKTAFKPMPGQMSGPAKTDFGYHIIKVTIERLLAKLHLRKSEMTSKRAQDAASKMPSSQLLSQLSSDITVTDSKYKNLGTTTPFGIE